MDVSAAVPVTRQLNQARERLDYAEGLRRAGLSPRLVPPLPELTDQECVALSQEFDAYSYDALRKAFPKRY